LIEILVKFIFNFKNKNMKSAYFFILQYLLLFALPAKSQKFSPLVNSFISVNNDTIALVHALVIDGTGQPAKSDQTIIIIKGRITGINNFARIQIPPNTRIIDCTNKTIIPGMIMMHEHMFYGEVVSPLYVGQEMAVSFPRLYLAGGVTTMRTTGSTEPQTDLNIRDWIRQGKIPGPDIDVTGPYIEREGLPIPEILFAHNPEEAAKEVNYWADMGCTSFKLYMDITKADMKASIEAAHKRGLKVTGHLCSITYREAANLGIDNLEHGFWVSSDFDPLKKEDECNQPAQSASLLKLDKNSPAMKDLMKLLINKNVTITSTLPVFEPYTGRELFPGGADSAVSFQARERVMKTYQFKTGKDSDNITMFKKEMFWERQFVQMGGRLMAGIDPTGAGRVIPGYADRHTLELLVEAGFTLPEAVKICSLNAAEYLGREKETGSIAVGKQADLILINGDIEKDIKNVKNTETVFKNGIGYNSQKLFESVKGMVGMY
jgi:imidazolonepropionase-like amidohydrolase